MRIVAGEHSISAQTIGELEKRQWSYILGARMRNQKEVRDEVLSRGGRYRVVRPKAQGSKAPSALKVKEVEVDDRRYIVCLNENQASPRYVC